MNSIRIPILVLLFGLCSSAESAERLKLQAPSTHGGFFAFAFSPDDKTVAGGTGVISVTSGKAQKFEGGGEVLLWDARTGKIKKNLGAHQASVTWLAWSKDGKLLASYSKENSLAKIWDITTGKARQTIKLPGRVADVAGRSPCFFLSPDGSSLIAVIAEDKAVGKSTTMMDSTIQAWDTKSGKETFKLPKAAARHAALSPDGTVLAISAAKVINFKPDADGNGASYSFADQHLNILDLKTKTVRDSFKWEDYSPNELIFTPDGKSVAGLNFQGAKLWDVSTGKATHEIAWDKSRSFHNAVVFAKDNNSLIRTNTEFVELLDAKTGSVKGQETFKFPEMLFYASFSSDLKRMATNLQAPLILDLGKLDPSPDAK